VVALLHASAHGNEKVIPARVGIGSGGFYQVIYS
jgi:hypothetical protein